MDSLTLIILVILAIALVSLSVFLVGKWRADSASAYERRVRIDAEYDSKIIKESKAFTIGNRAYITEGVIGTKITFREIVIDAQGQPITAETIDGKQVTAHQLASKLIDDSIRKNGGDAKQLLTATEWDTLGNTRDDHGIAVEYLRGMGLVRTVQGGKKNGQGTFITDSSLNHTKDLQGLILALAVNALPQNVRQPLKLS